MRIKTRRERLQWPTPPKRGIVPLEAIVFEEIKRIKPSRSVSTPCPTRKHIGTYSFPWSVAINVVSILLLV